jgi:hypothetical protein
MCRGCSLEAVVVFLLNALIMKALCSAIGSYFPVKSFASKTGIILFLGIICSWTMLQAQNPNVPVAGWGSDANKGQSNSAKVVASEFPTLQQNNNPDQIKEYQREKEEWIKTNPSEYQKMLDNSKAVQVKQISSEEFDRLPQEKKDFILSRPEQYKVVQRASDNH